MRCTQRLAGAVDAEEVAALEVDGAGDAGRAAEVDDVGTELPDAARAGMVEEAPPDEQPATATAVTAARAAART